MVAPAGPISLAEDYLEATLAGCAAFRTLVAAANPAAAKTSIHNDALPAPAAGEGYTKTELQALHPFGLIKTDPEGGYAQGFSSANSDGSHNYRDGGKLILRIYRQVTAGSEIADDERTWKNTVGQILDQLWALAGQAGYLAITAIAIEGWHRFHPDNEPAMGDVQGVTIGIHWGEAE